jgi:hypothetical protein
MSTADGEPDVLIGPYIDSVPGGGAFLQLGAAEGTVDVADLPAFLAQCGHGGGYAVAFFPDWTGDGGSEVVIRRAVHVRTRVPHNRKRPSRGSLLGELVLRRSLLLGSHVCGIEAGPDLVGVLDDRLERLPESHRVWIGRVVQIELLVRIDRQIVELLGASQEYMSFRSSWTALMSGML